MQAIALLVSVAATFEVGVPAQLEALAPHASGVALVEVLDLKEYDARPVDGNKRVEVRFKRIRGSGEFLETIAIVTAYGGLRPANSPPPKIRGPVWPDSFEKGKRYWLAFASHCEFGEYPQGVVRFWPEESAKIAEMMDQAIRNDVYRWSPQFDPRSGLTYGFLARDSRDAGWRIRVWKNEELLWERLIPGAKPERPISNPSLVDSSTAPHSTIVLVAWTSLHLDPESEYGLPAGAYCVGTSLDPKTGHRIATDVLFRRRLAGSC